MAKPALWVALCLWLPSLAWADPALWSALKSSHQAGQQLSYSGVLLTQVGQHVYTSRIVHMVQGSEQFEMLERLDGQDWRWLRFNSTMQTINPEKKRIVQEERKTPLLFTHVLSGSAADADLSELYSIQELPSKRVAGRMAKVIWLKPKDKLRYAYRVALEPSKHLVLRTEMLDNDGEVIESIGFSEIEFAPQPMPTQRLLEPAPGWTWLPVQVRSMDKTELPYSVPDKLLGFHRVETLLRRKANAPAVYQTVYTDGLSSVSLFVQELSVVNTSVHSVASQGAGHGGALSKTEVQGRYRVTVLGEVPEKTLSLLLRSIQFH